MQERNRTDIVSDRETKAFTFYMNTEGILPESEPDVMKITVSLRDKLENNILGQVQEVVLEHGKPVCYWVTNPSPSTLRFEDDQDKPYRGFPRGSLYFEDWEDLSNINYPQVLRSIESASHSLFVGSTPVDAQYAVEVRQISSTDIEKQILEIFKSGEGETFEDGMESNFSRSLSRFVRKYGSNGLVEVVQIILHGETNNEVVSEAILCLSRLDDCRTYQYRRWLIEKVLESEEFYIRDAAISGLSHLDDKDSIPAIEKAVSSEKNTELKEDMEKVLAELSGL
jgi:hypothetical protein